MALAWSAKLSPMRKPALITLSKVDTTIHATSRVAAYRVQASLIEDWEGMINTQECVEALILIRDFVNANLENIEGLSAGLAHRGAGGEI